MIAECPMAHNEATAPPPDKAALRRALLARRDALPSGAGSHAGARAAALLEALPRWREAREVLVYLAFRGEVDCSGIMEALWRRGARVLAPRCRPGERGVLDVACVSCLEELAPGAYGILEPDPNRCPALHAFAPDAALIPAVAYDRQGARLGFGQGYYDRLLARPALRDTFLVGLAHPFQVLDTLPTDPWDRPVHAVVTPEEVLFTG
ncbi:5-formyltetrahydrofolate cyclo-ligase [Fundidesulfovibrio magnetotacticus]|uniref:5-formyltetrahydrofolate cyclo-ligase n=1 Tax=Fundidesulfovibrio magnetotacticus TaxID=2730080 RepID=A0A6V8LSQ3_9BACT|nr:5-formyltetrahydrofolate cyclo-ligase [Fundidesulfovibrio magnetotacticus]GFK93348.1 5-formyltetrahydrofolate cyclo-ligase [Fundidesulfovibrio magnetotacticus]